MMHAAAQRFIIVMDPNPCKYADGSEIVLPEKTDYSD